MKILFLVLPLFITAALHAESEIKATDENYQQQNLFGNASSLGFAGGLTVRGAFIDNRLYPSVGGEGYLIIDHSFYIGGGGYGVPMNMTLDGGTNQSFSGVGWGGVILGYIFMPEWVVHPYAQVMIGAGGVGYYTNTGIYDGNAFFALDAVAGLEINVVKWIRFCPYVGYHLTAGNITVPGLNAAALSGWHFGITTKIGMF